MVNIDQKNRGLPHNKIVFWLESSYGCTSPILGKIGGASRIHYGGIAMKDSNKRQGSERHTRFQHFITFAIYNQILIFKHWNNS